MLRLGLGFKLAIGLTLSLKLGICLVLSLWLEPRFELELALRLATEYK